jgi:hypothetical protein
VFQVKSQPLVKVTDWVRTSSVPQEKPVLGVQAALVAGAVPVQLEFATTEPSERGASGDKTFYYLPAFCSGIHALALSRAV